MSRQRSDKRNKAFHIWEKSGRAIPLVQIAKRLGTSASLVRKWKYEDAWDAKPTRKRGGQPGNNNAIGNKGGGAPPGNKNNWKNGKYESMWLSEVAMENRLKLMKMETNPLAILLNELRLLEYREFKLMRYINMIESGWDGKNVEEKFQIFREEAGEEPLFQDNLLKFQPIIEEKTELIERKIKTPQMLERILIIENTLTQVQARKTRCIALLDQFDRNELTTEELQLKIQRMKLEVNKLEAEAW